MSISVKFDSIVLYTVYILFIYFVQTPLFWKKKKNVSKFTRKKFLANPYVHINPSTYGFRLENKAGRGYMWSHAPWVMVSYTVRGGATCGDAPQGLWLGYGRGGATRAPPHSLGCSRNLLYESTKIWSTTHVAISFSAIFHSLKITNRTRFICCSVARYFFPTCICIKPAFWPGINQ